MLYSIRLICYIVEDIHKNAKANGFNGILVNHTGDAATALELTRTPLPLSVVDIHDKDIRRRKKRTAFIGNRNREIGALGAKKLLSLGQFRRFVFVGHPARPVWSEDRRDGFCGELARHGLTAKILLQDDIRQALATLPRPLAVMTAWDYKAIEVLESCREIGLDVPADVAVIGVDADPLVCGFTNPPLTSIAPNFVRIGYCAAAALDAMMDGRKTRSINFIDCKPLDIVERASTKFLPPVEALLKHALDIIQRDAIHGLSVHDVAMRLGVSQQLLALRFRQYEQKSVRDLILDTRLEHVKELLKHTRRDFAAVARGTRGKGRGGGRRGSCAPGRREAPSRPRDGAHGDEGRARRGRREVNLPTPLINLPRTRSAKGARPAPARRRRSLARQGRFRLGRFSVDLSRLLTYLKRPQTIKPPERAKEGETPANR